MSPPRRVRKPPNPGRDHAPKGGENLDGRHYAGGQFSPGDFPACNPEERAKGEKALEEVIAGKGTVDRLAAFVRPGLGPISIYWGQVGKVPTKPFSTSTPAERSRAFPGGNGVSKIIAMANQHEDLAKEHTAMAAQRGPYVGHPGKN